MRVCDIFHVAVGVCSIILRKFVEQSCGFSKEENIYVEKMGKTTINVGVGKWASQVRLVSEKSTGRGRCTLRST